MGEYLTEDEVRETAGKILGFTKLENGHCRVGQNGISTVLKTNSLIISDSSNALNKPTLPNNQTI